MWFRRLVRIFRAEFKRQGIERSVASALGIFRLASWGLTSLVYLAGTTPMGVRPFKLAVVGLLFVAAILSTWLLARASEDTKQIAGLALAEALALPAVLIPTGGMASPFVWYALNPLLVAAVYLPIGYTWGVVCTFLGASFAATAISPITQGRPLTEHAQVALILVLVTLTTRVQARLLRVLEGQSKKIAQQSVALGQAYEALAVRGQALSALLDFQREAISSLSHSELYRVLIGSLRERFESEWAGVLYVGSESDSDLLSCPWLPEVPGCGLVQDGGETKIDWAAAWALAQHMVHGPDNGSSWANELGHTIAPLAVEGHNLVALLAVRGLEELRRTELQVWLEYARQLGARITAANRMRHTLDYLSDVYQLVEGAGVSHQEGDLLELFTLYAKQLTGAEKAAYWPADADDPDALRPMPSIIRGRKEGILAEEFSSRVAEWWGASTSPVLANLDRYDDGTAEWHACYTVVRSSDRRFGVLFVLSSRPFSMDIDVVRTMGFLGYVAGAMLERQRAEDLHGRLLVAEEKSRIAAEIHDGASQGLFSLVYGIQGAIGSLAAGRLDEAQKMLETSRNVAADVSREIRTAIYQLTQADGSGAFVRAVRGYLDDIGELYGLNTTLSVAGSEDNLSPALRRAVYRIVREAASNAARHGHSRLISVSMSLSPQQTIVEIQDDGSGFEPPPPAVMALRTGTGARSGLGLLNMHQLARSFSGALVVDSAPGKGTRVTARIPEHVAEEGGVREVAASR